jgi:hypothetical protein
MKSFLLKTLLFLSPAIIILAAYFILDPFRIIFSYSEYSDSYVFTSRDYVSTETYLKNRGLMHYNSFIFGSSRTLAYKINSWRKYLGKDDVPFVFDANGESIYGIYTKIKYIDQTGDNINNALIVICNDVTFETEAEYHKQHIFMKHPEFTDNTWFNFHKTFLSAFYNIMFLKAIFTYKILGKYEEYMKDFINESRINYDKTTNEMSLTDKDSELAASPREYYQKRKGMFYSRNGEITDSAVKIKPEHIEMMNEIKKIFDRNHTEYYIIISPLYDQRKFNPADIAALKRIFGERVYDFSGKNELTDDYQSYYEISHYRPLVADSILKKIYGSQSSLSKSTLR